MQTLLSVEFILSRHALVVCCAVTSTPYHKNSYISISISHSIRPWNVRTERHARGKDGCTVSLSSTTSQQSCNDTTSPERAPAKSVHKRGKGTGSTIKMHKDAVIAHRETHHQALARLVGPCARGHHVHASALPHPLLVPRGTVDLAYPRSSTGSASWSQAYR